MRILHIDAGRQLRGGQRQAILLMQTLHGVGHDCVLMARRDGDLWRHAESHGFPPVALSLLSLWRESPGYDLVHAHDARAHSMAALACRVPFVVSRRVAFPVSRSVASRWKYRRPARFLAVSRFVADQLQLAAVPAGRIDLVYDAVEARTSTAVWNPRLGVVALSSDDPQKGRDLVERASQISRIPVVFSNNLFKDLQHASLFLYISRSEGFGSAALLAMSMGVPVIASRTGGLTEAFEDGLSGIAVANDPVAIAGAIEKVLRDPELACFLIENARRRISQNFTPAHLLSRTMASYARALDR